MSPLFPNRALLKGVESAHFEHVISDKAERERWEKFVVRAANTPGRDRVVLRLSFVDGRGGEWFLWAVYRFHEEPAIDKARIALEQIYMSQPGEPAAPPDELKHDAVFEVH